ncbi:vacuolar protein sorting-associated protein 45 [Malassezia cuniculi]|uniref:Vacuolar protein sorting-associated protein 45 n=1 Tax=Malassezia cuniculi TaxID=948313 RepID=A0AAF0EY76_9BASI|nr:vacuolar protein sorting-associated protein 45 [Malassezia cuniculi]
MDVCRAVAEYIERMLVASPGLKVLLLDEHTTPTVSAAFTQSQLLAHEVYLVTTVGAHRDRMAHLQCVVFVRPDDASLAAVRQELMRPRYGSYYLGFSNAVSKSAIEALAEADTHQLVKEVHEYYADYLPVTPTLFSLSYEVPPAQLWGATPESWNGAALARHTEALVALLLSLRKRPVVRYERKSALARALAEAVTAQTTQPGLADLRRADVPPLLLIVDRRSDPVTPLLTQWTYQAMVHELVGIRNGRTRIRDTEVVLSADNDPFFAENMYDNYGDLGAAIKEYVSQFQAKTHSSASLETVQDMKRFVEEYPEFQRLRGNVSKHVALLGELSRRIDEEHLLQVSELEQSLAGTENHAADLRTLKELITNTQISAQAKLRLVLLYALRFERYPGAQTQSILTLARANGVSDADAALADALLGLCGADSRQGDLFAHTTLFSRGKSALTGLRGVDNVYTQHSPQLATTLDSLFRGKLRTGAYPFASTPTQDVPATVIPGGQCVRPRDVIVFVIGGATYEEARSVALLNGESHVILGGTTIHNSTSFLAMVRAAAASLSLAPRVADTQQPDSLLGRVRRQVEGSIP